MQVLHLAAGNLFGGIEQTLVTFARERDLVPPMEPRFAVCFEGKLSRELHAIGCSPLVLGEVRSRAPWTVIRARRKLHSLLAANCCDVLVCHGAWCQAIFAPVARAARIPQVFWLHDVPSGRHWLEKWAGFHAPDFTICNSRFTASHLQRIFPDARCVVIYNPVRSDRWEPAEPVGALRADLPCDSGTVTIVHASRMDPGKGHRVLLDALQRLSGLSGWRCWIAGGPQRPTEHAYASELSARTAALGLSNRVRFLGLRDDVSQLMRLADVYCQPNERPEAFGNSFVEALYQGLPVVTSAFGGALEIVDDSCGRLVRPGAAGELSAALESLIRDAELRRSLGVAARARARALCAPEIQMATIGRVLADVAQ